MERLDPPAFAPGGSILGGAAGGLSYEGALRDAVARDEIQRRRDAGRTRQVAPPQVQSQLPGAVPSREANGAKRRQMG